VFGVKPEVIGKLYGLAGEEAVPELLFGEAVTDKFRHVKDQGPSITKEQLGVSTDEVSILKRSLDSIQKFLG